jgi:peptidoglycan hydrolase-like protein with peptidoglycan-binding domain
MILGFIVLITGLTISAVSSYYSVAGLVAIFASATIPIIIMGGSLEIGKLVTAVWLHRYWNRSPWWLTTYLTMSVIVLMLITSMGIFGFLSKAHIAQTASASEGIAQIERIDVELTRQSNIISRSRAEILSIETNGNSQDNIVEQQIDREQARIDSAYNRIQPVLDEQQTIIDQADSNNTQRTLPLQTEVESINSLLNNLQLALTGNDIELAQGIVGTPVDGNYGSNTARAVDEFRTAKNARRDELVTQLNSIRNEPTSIVNNARLEIQRIRSVADQQVADSNTLISRLRSQLGSINVEQLTIQIEEQQTQITEATQVVNQLNDQKFDLESDYRKLEAEVGPIKYLAEFIYGDDASKDVLEEAVRWVIIIIIFVFDPLAILLLIASQHTFKLYREERADLKQEIDHESSNKHNKSVPADSASDSGTRVSRSDNGLHATSTAVCTARITGAAGARRDMVLQQARKQELDDDEEDEDQKAAKRQWKESNPEETVREYKDAYIKGDISTLPWKVDSTNNE